MPADDNDKAKIVLQESLSKKNSDPSRLSKDAKTDLDIPPIFAESDKLFEKTEEWRKAGGFKHRKPCKDWLAGRRCSHYAKARYRHFKTEIDEVVSLMFGGTEAQAPLGAKATEYPPEHGNSHATATPSQATGHESDLDNTK